MTYLNGGLLLQDILMVKHVLVKE